jgi:hypothetical protein
MRWLGAAPPLSASDFWWPDEQKYNVWPILPSCVRMSQPAVVRLQWDIFIMSVMLVCL